MQTVVAVPSITTRIRPTAQICGRPVPETLTSHFGVCPHCQRETHIRLGGAGTIYGGCSHFAAIEQCGTEIRILFSEAAA
jgi:hypothetical protein